MGIRILIADDHKLMRDGIRSLLEKRDGMEVVAAAENGRSAVKLTRKLKPDVVIMDISMPDLNGIEATRQIISELPDTKVLALSIHSDKQFVSQMLKVGAMGYLLKDCTVDELTHAIYAAINSKTYLSPGVANTVIKDYVNLLAATDSSKASVLTAREREVLQLISEGRKTRQIALDLHVSVKTIETHRRQIMEKLNIHNVADLTKFALREGLTSLEI
ncbi:MAG: response regulator transcription factor [Desulfobacterales bacterium]|nr:response regulator transcription factor [Desulfobacterales bacterium]MDD4391734.1 response regulator transcription factor [Desulfobacterales bacterium]